MSLWTEAGLGIHTRSVSWMGHGPMAGLSSGGAGNALWPAANLIIYAPITIYRRFLLLKFLMATGTGVAGNFNQGLYSMDGTLLASTGSTAHPASTLTSTAPTAAFVVAPGRYHLAMIASDAATDNYLRSATSTLAGLAAHGWLQEQAGSFALPSIATFATMAYPYAPHMGMSRDVGNQ